MFIKWSDVFDVRLNKDDNNGKVYIYGVELIHNPFPPGTDLSGSALVPTPYFDVRVFFDIEDDEINIRQWRIE